MAELRRSSTSYRCAWCRRVWTGRVWLEERRKPARIRYAEAICNGCGVIRCQLARAQFARP